MNAEGHEAQRERRREQAPRALHGAERAPEAGAVVLQDALHLPEERSQVRGLGHARRIGGLDQGTTSFLIVAGVLEARPVMMT